MKVVEAKPAQANMRAWVEGETIEGKAVKKGVLLPLGEKGPARERLKKMGLTIMTLGDEVTVGAVAFGSRAEKLGLETGLKFRGVEVRPSAPTRSGCSSRPWFCSGWSLHCSASGA